ncbi:hypothetical protein ACFE04_023275 [Oxalis oulophora]
MDSLTILFSLLLIASSIVYPSEGVSQDILKKLCDKADHPDNCTELLTKSIPKLATATPRNISLLTIEMLQNRSAINLKYFEDQYINTMDGYVNDQFRLCMFAYHSIQTSLLIAHKASTLGNFKVALQELVNVDEYATKCDNGFEHTPDPIDKIDYDMYFKTQAARSVAHYLRYNN